MRGCMQAGSLYGELRGRASGAAAYCQQKAGEAYEGARSAVATPEVCITIMRSLSRMQLLYMRSVDFKLRLKLRSYLL